MFFLVIDIIKPIIVEMLTCAAHNSSFAICLTIPNAQKSPVHSCTRNNLGGVVQVKMNSILAAYRNNHQIINARIVNDEDIYVAKLFSSGDIIEPGEAGHTLFFAENVEPDSDYPENLIFVTAPEEILTERIYNWIQIPAEGYSTLAEDISRILSDQFQLQSLQLETVMSLNEGTGLISSFSKAARMLNSSVVAMDLSGRIIASSTPFELKDPLWQESVSKGYCPPFFVDHINDVREKSSSATEPSRSSSPRINRCPQSKLHYMSCRLYNNSLLYGYLFFIQESEIFHHLSEQVMDVLEDGLMRSIKPVDYDPVNDDLIYHKLLTDIFDGISPDQILSRLKSGKILLPKNMIIACIRPRYYKGEDYIRQCLISELRALIPDSRLLIYRRYIVAVLSVQQPEKTSLAFHSDSLLSFCKQEQLFCGISDPFSDPQVMKIYFEQARRTSELANAIQRTGGIYYYKDYAIYDVISSAAENQKVEYCCHPALGILQQYDNSHDGSLYSTLKALVANDFNSNATASALFIHRNTLGYRKQKITELTGLNLEDLKTRYQLYFSFSIIELINAFKGSPTA